MAQINLHHLRLFRAVATEDSLTAAARRLNFAHRRFPPRSARWNRHLAMTFSNAAAVPWS